MSLHFPPNFSLWSVSLPQSVLFKSSVYNGPRKMKKIINHQTSIDTGLYEIISQNFFRGPRNFRISKNFLAKAKYFYEVSLYAAVVEVYFQIRERRSQSFSLSIENHQKCCSHPKKCECSKQRAISQINEKSLEKKWINTAQKKLNDPT